MPSDPRRILLFGSSHRIGLTSLMVEMATAVQASNGASLLVVTGEREQFPGLFAILEGRGIASAQIEGLDEHGRFWPLARQLSRLIREFRPQVVHAQTNWQMAQACAARSLARSKCAIFYTVHGYRHNAPLKALVARLAMSLALRMFADKILVPSSFLAARFRCLGKKRGLLFLGVDEVFFTSTGPVNQQDRFRMVFGGQFRRGKNQAMLIRACAGLLERGCRDWELVLPGQGELLDECKALARTLGVAERVNFPGQLNREEMLQTYLSCLVALVPTNVETFGLCIAEPFVLGRIVVTRRVGVAEDVLVHGKNGFFFESEADLVDILEKLVKMDRSRWSEISKQALQDREVFRWSQIARQYGQILDSIEV